MLFPQPSSRCDPCTERSIYVSLRSRSRKVTARISWISPSKEYFRLNRLRSITAAIVRLPQSPRSTDKRRDNNARVRTRFQRSSVIPTKGYCTSSFPNSAACHFSITLQPSLVFRSEMTLIKGVFFVFLSVLAFTGATPLNSRHSASELGVTSESTRSLDKDTWPALDKQTSYKARRQLDEIDLTGLSEGTSRFASFLSRSYPLHQ